MKKLTFFSILTLLTIPQSALAQTNDAQSISGTTLVWIAYASLWILILGYLIMLGARQKRIEKELQSLRRSIDKEIGLTDDESLL